MSSNFLATLYSSLATVPAGGAVAGNGKALSWPTVRGCVEKDSDDGQGSSLSRGAVIDTAAIVVYWASSVLV